MSVTTAKDSRAQTLALGAVELGLDLSNQQSDLLLRYLDLLAHWNQAYNLTAIRDSDSMLTHHLLDSLAIAPFMFGEAILDIGTGAGLPGIPLAILARDRHFRLLDGNGKKVRFVRQVVLELGLENVEPVHHRIESYRPGQNFSTIVARAVSSVAQIHAQAAPILASPGRLFVMKGRHPGDELENPALAGLDLTVHPLEVPFLTGDRCLIEIRRE